MNSAHGFLFQGHSPVAGARRWTTVIGSPQNAVETEDLSPRDDVAVAVQDPSRDQRYVGMETAQAGSFPRPFLPLGPNLVRPDQRQTFLQLLGRFQEARQPSSWIEGKACIRVEMGLVLVVQGLQGVDQPLPVRRREWA